MAPGLKVTSRENAALAERAGRAERQWLARPCHSGGGHRFDVLGNPGPRMSDRKLLLIALVFAAAASIRCAGSPSEPEGSVIITQTTSTTTTTAIPTLIAGAIGTSPAGTGLAAATVFTVSLVTRPQWVPPNFRVEFWRRRRRGGPYTLPPPALSPDGTVTTEGNHACLSAVSVRNVNGD